MFAEGNTDSYSIVDDNIFYYSDHSLPVDPTVSFIFCRTLNSSVSFNSNFYTFYSEGPTTFKLKFSGTVGVPLYLYKNNELLKNISSNSSSIIIDVEFGNIYYVTDVLFLSSDFFALRFPLYVPTIIRSLVFLGSSTAMSGSYYSDTVLACFLNPLPLSFFNIKVQDSAYCYYSNSGIIPHYVQTVLSSDVYYLNPRISLDSFINNSVYDFVILNNSVPFYLSVNSDSDFLVSFTFNQYTSSSGSVPHYSVSYTILTSHLKNIYIPLPDNSTDYYKLLNFGVTTSSAGSYTELIINNVQELVDLRGFFRPLSTFYSHLLDPLVYVSSSNNVSFIIAFIFSIISILILIFIIVFAIFRIRKGKG